MKVINKNKSKSRTKVKQIQLTHSSAADPLLASNSSASIVRARSRVRALRTSAAHSSLFKIPKKISKKNESCDRR